jgi:hypothetical protein
MGLTGWVSIVATTGNLGYCAYNVVQARRRERLNATLFALCVNSYMLRSWPSHRHLGFVLNVRPMTPAEWQAEQG